VILTVILTEGQVPKRRNTGRENAVDIDVKESVEEALGLKLSPWFEYYS